MLVGDAVLGQVHICCSAQIKPQSVLDDLTGRRAKTICRLMSNYETATLMGRQGRRQVTIAQMALAGTRKARCTAEGKRIRELLHCTWTVHNTDVFERGKSKWQVLYPLGLLV